MKKKITAIFLCVALVAIAIAGASLAYFTDTDNETNTFTTGKVDITLNEIFDKDNAKLLPGSQTKNAVQKEVTIKVEDGSEDTYVWYEWLIPAALDTVGDASKNIVHVNSPGRTWDKWRENENFWAEGQTEPLPIEKTWDHSYGEKDGYIGDETIEGITYHKYVTLYHGLLKAGEETTVGMSQVYMDEHVDTNNQGQYTYNGTVIDYDFSNGVNIIVRAYGIQADGFTDVYAAYEAYNA